VNKRNFGNIQNQKFEKLNKMLGEYLSLTTQLKRNPTQMKPSLFVGINLILKPNVLKGLIYCQYLFSMVILLCQWLLNHFARMPCFAISRQEKRMSKITKNEMFRSIINQAVINEVKFEYVLADNCFEAKKIWNLFIMT
jgi:hypothetical protein